MKIVIYLAVGIQQEAIQMELSNILRQKVLIKSVALTITRQVWLISPSSLINKTIGGKLIEVQMRQQYRKVMKKRNGKVSGKKSRFLSIYYKKTQKLRYLDE